MTTTTKTHFDIEASNISRGSLFLRWKWTHQGILQQWMNKSSRMAQYTPRNCFSGQIIIAITSLLGIEQAHSLLQQSERCYYRMLWHKSRNKSWLKLHIRKKQQGGQIFKLARSNRHHSNNRIKPWWSHSHRRPCNQLTCPALATAVLIQT